MKRKLLLIFMILFTNNIHSYSEKINNYNFKYGLFTNYRSNKNKKNSFINSFSLDVDAYILCENDYEKMNINNVNEYLKNGGIIINEKNVDDNLFKRYFNINTQIQIDEEISGTYIYFNGQKNDLVAFALQKIDDKKIIEINDNTENMINDVIYNAKNKINKLSDNKTLLDSKAIEQIIYEGDNTTKICTYLLTNYLYKTQNEYIIENNFSIETFSNYAVINYSIQCGVSTNLKIGANSYIDLTNNQNITLDTKNLYTYEISSSANENLYNEQVEINNYANLTGINNNQFTFYSQVTSLSLKDNGWWIFQKKYDLDIYYKRKIVLNWN